MNDYCPGATQSPQTGGGGLDASLPPRATWHITWDALRSDSTQPDFGAVSNYLKTKAYCPHIMWNPFTGYMEQYYPASQSARALAAWNQDGAVNVQVEVFFSPNCVVDGVRYATVADTPLIGFDTLLNWMDGLGIPRVWPLGSPQWQGNSRDRDIWNREGGHYGHCNVPDNTHTDPGPMPSLNRGITTQGTTNTEGFLMALSDEEQRRVLAAADRINYVVDDPKAKILTENHLDDIADAVLGREVPWYGFDGNRPTEGRDTTTLKVATGYTDATTIGLHGAIAGLKELVTQISVKQGVTIDYQAIARAVNDDQAARMAE